MNGISLFFKRRAFVVRPDIQYRLMFSAIGYGVFCMLAVAACLLYPLVAELQQVDGNSEEALAAAEQLLYIVESSWFLLPLCVVAIALASLRLSHRIAGPLNRFHAVFEGVKNGHVIDPVQLRTNDLLQKDMVLVNEMLDSLREFTDEKGRIRGSRHVGENAPAPSEVVACVALEGVDL